MTSKSSAAIIGWKCTVQFRFAGCCENWKITALRFTTIFNIAQPQTRCRSHQHVRHANSHLVEAVVTINVMPWPSRLDSTLSRHGGLATYINRLSRLALLSAPIDDVMGEQNVASRAVKIRVKGSSHFACILKLLLVIFWVCVHYHNSFCSFKCWE